MTEPQKGEESLDSCSWVQLGGLAVVKHQSGRLVVAGTGPGPGPGGAGPLSHHWENAGGGWTGEHSPGQGPLRKPFFLVCARQGARSHLPAPRERAQCSRVTPRGAQGTHRDAGRSPGQRCAGRPPHPPSYGSSHAPESCVHLESVTIRHTPCSTDKCSPSLEEGLSDLG